MKKVLLFLLCIGTFSAFSQTKLKTQDINIFKNGTYYVFKTGNIQKTNGKFLLDVPGSPLLGTIWINSSQKIDQIIFKSDTVQNDKYALNINEILQANINNEVTFRYMPVGVLEEITGIIRKSLPTSNLCIVEVDNQLKYLQTSKIIDISISSSKIAMLKKDSITRSAAIDFNNNALNSAPVVMSYMQAGLQWTPSYKLHIIDKNNCNIEMIAILENTAEAITNANLTLTVGNPTFHYGSQLSPLATPYLSSVAQTYNSNAYANGAYAYQNTLSYVTLDESVDDYSYDWTIADQTASGDKSRDLYMFDMGKIDIPMNSKIILPVFSKETTYEDIYSVDISDNINYQTNRSIYLNPNQKFSVYHSLKIKNSTQHPFTTAPIFILDENDQPLAQNEMKYTSKEGYAKIQLSETIDIRIKNTEEETGMVESAKKVYKTYYNKVSIKGEIPVTNYLDEKVNLDVKKSINGNIETASNDGKITKNGRYNSINPFSNISWDIELKPGETKTLTYTYYVYITR